jgi:hypothetical protein
VPDSVEGFAGPLAGVLAGMDWAAAEGHALLVSAAADTPFFPETLVADLHAAMAREGTPLAMAMTPDPERGLSRHPTFGLWSVSAARGPARGARRRPAQGRRLDAPARLRRGAVRRSGRALLQREHPRRSRPCRGDAGGARAMRLYGVTGWKNSGKTTLVERLVAEITGRGLSVSTLKHAHHAFDVDQPGKDSHRHREAGARQVLVASHARWALMTRTARGPGADAEPICSPSSRRSISCSSRATSATAIPRSRCAAPRRRRT